MSDYSDILISVNGSKATVAINRPDRSNAVRPQTIQELTTAFDHLGDDPSVRVIVLTGVGERSFCAGADVTALGDVGRQEGHRMARKQAHLYYVMRNIDQPVIARINGACLGFGNELELFCDLAIAAEHAKFGQVGPMVGSVPVIGTTQLLPGLIGDRRAREVVYLCERYTAAQAEQMGWINKVVPAAELDAAVDAWCERIAGMSPQSIRIAKLAINYHADQAAPAFAHGVELVHEMWDSPDWREGMAAVRERRPPRFAGP